MALNILLEASPLDNGVPKTIRMSSAAVLSDGTQVDGLEWSPVITSPPTPNFSISSGGGEIAPMSISLGSVSFKIGRASGNLSWNKLSWNGQPVTVYIGETNKPFSDYRVWFTGTMSGFSRTGNIAELALRTVEGQLDVPLLSARMAGTGGSEGPAGKKGTLKPYCLGNARIVAPVEVDPALLVYQVHGYGPVADIPQVYEFAQAYAPAKADVASWADLVAYTLVPGEWITCKALGMFRLGGRADKKLTADVIGGSINGVAPQTVAGQIPLLMQAAGVSPQRIGDMSAFNFQWSFYATEQVTVAEVIKQAALDAGGYVFPDKLGKWQSGRHRAAKAATDIRADRTSEPLLQTINEPNVADPVWKVEVGHTRCWAVHSESDVSPKIIELEGKLVAADEVLEGLKDQADQAAADAEFARKEIEEMLADGVFDRSDKRRIIDRLEAERIRHTKLAGEYGAYSVAAQWADYDAAWNNVEAYVTGLTPSIYDNSANTPVDRNTYLAQWAQYENTLQTLLNKITGRTSQTASWPLVSGAGKPEDNATVGAPDGTYVGSQPATQLVADTADAKGKANTAIDALKDGQGNVRPVRDIMAEAKTASDAAVADAKKAGTDAQAQITQARTDLAKDITAAKAEGTTARQEAAQVRNDLTPTITAAQTAARKANDDLTAEISRAQGAEGAISTRVTQAQDRADGAHTAISTVTTQFQDADRNISQRIDTVVSTANTDRGNLNTRITNEVATLTGKDEVIGRRVDAVETQATTDRGNLNTRIDDEATASVNRDNAIGTRTNSLETTANRLTDTTAKSFPGFEVQSSNWGYDTELRGRNTGSGWEPGHSKGAGIAFPPGFGTWLYMDPSGWVKTTPGKRYRAGFWIWQWSAPNGYGGNARVYWEGHNKDHTVGSYLGSTDNSPEATRNFYTPVPNGAWHCYASDIQVDDAMVSGANSYWIRPRINVDGAPANAGYVIAGWFFREVTGEFDNAAKIKDEATASANRDNALGNRISTTEAKLSGDQDSWLAARVRDEATASANRDNALGNRISVTDARSSGGGNLLNNTDFYSKSGWTLDANGMGLTLDAQSGSYWNPRGEAVLIMSRASTAPSDTYAQVTTEPFAVQADSFIQFYALTSSHRSRAWTSVFYYDENGAWAGYAGENYAARTDNGGPDLAAWDQTGIKSVRVPSNARSARFAWRVYDNGNSDPVGWLFHPYVGYAREGQTEWNPYSTGSGKQIAVQTNARITDEAIASANRDNALGNRVSSTEAKLNGSEDSWVAGRVRDEATASANRDSALGNRLNTTEAQFRGEQDSALKTLINNQRSNLALVDWWKKGAGIPWGANGGQRNEIVQFPHGGNFDNLPMPDGSSGDAWLCQADGGGQAAGGWNGGQMVRLDPDKTYRFVVPIAALGGAGGSNSGTRISYWGTGGVCDLNTTNDNGNPYFAIVGNMTPNKWHLFVGFLFPRNSTGRTHEGAGVWDMTTGIKIADGTNYCFHTDGRQPTHRAYQYYASNGAYQAFGRPIVEEVNGSELNIMAALGAAKKATQADARITDEATASANRDSALGTRINTTEAKLNGDQDSTLAARIRDESTASVNRDNAVANRATALEARGTQAGNLVPNSSLIAARTNDVIPGWSFGGSGNFDRRQVNAPDTNYYLSNENVFCSHKNNGSDGQYGEWASDFIPVIGSDWYQYYSLANSHRCTVTVFLYCYDLNKNLIANTTTAVGANQGALGYALGHYLRVGSLCEQLPPATAWVRLMLRHNDTTPGQGDSWAWFLHPYLSRARQGQTEWNAYSTGTDRPSTTDIKARIEDVSTTLTNADAALSSRINTTEAQLSGGQDSWVAARIRDEATASANRDTALTGRTNTIEAATLTGAGVARNDKFALWKDGAQYPDGWYTWVGEGNYRIERNAGIAGTPYCIRTLNDYAETSGGFMQVVPVYAGKWIVEVTAESDVSGFRGAGMTLHGQHSIDFCSDPDTNGFQGDKGNAIRSWSKAFDFTQDFVNSIGGNVNFHAMWGWLGFGRGTAAKYMRWHHMVLKPAGLGDAEAIRANARISTEETTRTNQYNALATRSTDLEAQVVNDGMNLLRNGTFNAPGWVPNTGLPPYWGGWANDAGAYIGAYSGGGSKYGAKYPLQIDRGGDNNGIHQRLPAQGAGWYVAEVDVTFEDGNHLGSGFHWNFQDAQGHAIDFGRDPDTNGGVVSGGLNVNRKFSKLVYVGFAPAFINCYLMAGWGGFSTGQGFLRTIWHKVSFRMASEAEIAAKKVLDANIIARVQSSEGAIANVQTKVATAWSEKTVSAGTSAATIMMRATDDNGNATSDVTLAATRIALRNTETGGISKGGMVMSGGNAVFDGSITANGGILVGNGKLKVQVQAQDYAVSHDQRVDFGYDLGRAPTVTFGSCPVALTTDEVYAPYAADLTSTGFTAKLVINSAPQSAGQTTGGFANQGNNTWDGSKSGKPNAANGTYTLTVNLQATAQAYADNQYQ